jgi:hypothetical protein
MTQWFRGQLEGHYVGTGQSGPAVSQHGSADRYKLRIYRALVRDIETLDSKGEPPHVAESDLEEGESSEPCASEGPVVAPVEIPDECFYQAKIEDTRLIGIRPRTCFEGTIYDVAVSKLRVTHSTKKGEKTYGRVVGEVYGRFLLPPEADPEAAAQVVEELTAKTTPHEPGSEEAIAALGAEAAAEDDDEELEALHAPAAPMEGQAAAQVPVPLLAIVMGLLLWLGAGILPALVWIGLFIPILVVRFILGDQFRITSGQRIFGALLVAAQFACLAVILLDWWTASCIALNPVAAAGVGVTLLVASVLPSSFPVLCTGVGFAGVLFLGSGSVAATCESLQPKPEVEQTIERPTVNHPGVPRTNDDGSWPRRGPRTPVQPPVPAP